MWLCILAERLVEYAQGGLQASVAYIVANKLHQTATTMFVADLRHTGFGDQNQCPRSTTVTCRVIFDQASPNGSGRQVSAFPSAASALSGLSAQRFIASRLDCLSSGVHGMHRWRMDACAECPGRWNLEGIVPRRRADQRANKSRRETGDGYSTSALIGYRISSSLGYHTSAHHSKGRLARVESGSLTWPAYRPHIEISTDYRLIQ